MVKIKKPTAKTMNIGATKPPIIQKAKNKTGVKAPAKKQMLDTSWEVQIIKSDKKQNKNFQKDTKTKKDAKHLIAIIDTKEEPTENCIKSVSLRQNKGKIDSTSPKANKNGKKSFIKATDETGKEIVIKSEWGKMQLPEAPKKDILDDKFNIDFDVIEEATSGVFALIKNRQEEKNELFDDAEPIFLQIIAVKVPKCPWRIIRLPIKHSLLTEASEVCLIASDNMNIGRKKHDRVIEHFEQLLKANGIEVVKRILPYHELQTEYNQYELKRRLADQYDAFLVEGKIDGYAFRKLGKIFYKKHKMPTPVKLEPSNIKKSIEAALLKVPLYMHSKGDSYSIKIGHTNMSEKEIAENVCCIIKSLDEEFPGGFENIRSLHLKGSNTPSVPIYVTLKDKSLVRVPVIKHIRPKNFVPVEGELTTRTNVAVKVYPWGQVVTSTLKESAVDEDDNDEEEEIEEETAVSKEIDENDYFKEEKQNESTDETEQTEADKIKKTTSKRKVEVSKKTTKNKKQKK